MRPDVTPVIQATIQAWEEAFPGLIRSWYLLGSHADNSAVALSDLDLFFVLARDASTAEDEAKANAVVKNLRDRFPIKIEAWGETVEFLNRLAALDPAPRALIHTVSIKHGSVLLKGDDIREEIHDPPIEKYVAALTSIALGWIEERRKRGGDLADGDTKALVQSVLSIAAAMVARDGKVLIPKKSRILPEYRSKGDPRWLPLVEKAHEVLWQRWEYRLPREKADCALLQDCREEASALEAHFERFCSLRTTIET